MNITIQPGKLKGNIRAVDSKSHAHRLLIASAMALWADKPVLSFRTAADEMISDTSEDLSATAACLETLLDHLSAKKEKDNTPDELPAFYCGESGSTLRFLLPLSIAAGKGGIFYGGGKLPQRPLAPLDEELIKHGAVIDRNSGTCAKHKADCPQSEICRICLPEGGSLAGGEYRMPGHISSQYITGLLMALPLIPEDSQITITTPLQSRAYIDITLAVLKQFGIEVTAAGSDEKGGTSECPVYLIKGGQRYTMPDANTDFIRPEGDWSNGAFWLVADALGSDIDVSNLDHDSPQGDKAITEILRQYKTIRNGMITIDASDIPDLVPVISVLAALSPVNTRIVNAGRLRIKESDRLKTTCGMLGALGADISETEDGLMIEGRRTLDGGSVSGEGDHRIVMAAAIAATCCTEPVTITGAEAAAKSYPGFFEDYKKLGGVFSIIS